MSSTSWRARVWDDVVHRFVSARPSLEQRLFGGGCSPIVEADCRGQALAGRRPSRSMCNPDDDWCGRRRSRTEGRSAVVDEVGGSPAKIREFGSRLMSSPCRSQLTQHQTAAGRVGSNRVELVGNTFETIPLLFLRKMCGGCRRDFRAVPKSTVERSQ